MKKILGLSSLIVINTLVLYLIYWYIGISASLKVDNFFHIPYEPSGMQLFFYIISLPLFLFLSALSAIHSYYFELKKSLSLPILCIWLSYFILIEVIDWTIHFSAGNNILYIGTLIISFVAAVYIIWTTWNSSLSLIKPLNNSR